MFFTVALAQEPEVPALSELAELTVQIDGQPARLLDLPGPLVIDLWATWCAPCKDALPEFDALARDYKGRVTFVAVSVDPQQKKMASWLARRGEHAFVVAWGGWQAFEALERPPVPLTYVLDADHQLVLAHPGWQPGSAELRAAVERAVGP